MNTKKNPSDQPCLNAALEYAGRGWPVIALHTIRNGACTCRKGKDCGSPGKHPRWMPGTLEHGLKDATTDPDVIRAWWEKYPDSNVGIATGARSFDALDIDIKPDVDGNDTLHDLIEEHNPLPNTVEQITGSGGRQIFFKPSGRLKNEVKFAPGLNIRTDGGLVVAPPSLHLSGKRYEWEVSSHPDEVPLADMPAWLIEIAAGTAQQESSAPNTARIVEGPLSISDRERRHGERALETARKMVQHAVDGEKHHVLLKAAKLLGGYVAGGMLTFGQAVNTLRSEIGEKANVASLEDAYKTIDQSLKHGMEHPISFDALEKERIEYCQSMGFQTRSPVNDIPHEHPTNGTKQYEPGPPPKPSLSMTWKSRPFPAASCRHGLGTLQQQSARGFKSPRSWQLQTSWERFPFAWRGSSSSR